MFSKEKGNLTYDTELAETLFEELHLIEEFKDYRGYLFRFATNKDFYSPFPSFEVQPRPSWIKNLPTIKGYITVLGTASRHSYRHKSLEAADTDALIQGINALHAKINSESYSYSDNLGGEFLEEKTILEGVGEVEGFTILDRWEDPEKGYYFTLAIIPFK